MRAKFALGTAAALAFMGCASTSGGIERGERDFSGVAHRGVSSVRIGEAHVVDTRVNPLMPVRVSFDGNEVVVNFARLGRSGAVARLDASSLQPLSLQPGSEDRSAHSTEAERVVLDGGRFVVCWTRGSVEWGHRALVQAFNADGSPRGAPAVISPPNVDVIGAPRAITTDGRHIVATFAAASGNSFQVMAVPIEDAEPVEGPELTAWR
jgi:hypothetical protein